MGNERTVFVVDDDQAVCRSVGALISSAGVNVETFATAQEFLDAYAPNQPGCLVLDVRLPGMSGLELQKKLKAAGIKIPVIFITGYGDVRMAVQAVQRGAVDVLEKPFAAQALLDRIDEAMERDAQARRHDAEGARVAARVGRLTPRERQIMETLVDGNSVKVIAARMQISPKTVDFHRKHILKKMEVDSPTRLVRLVLTGETI